MGPRAFAKLLKNEPNGHPMKVIPTTLRDTTVKPRFIPFKKNHLDHYSHMSEVSIWIPIWISTVGSPLGNSLWMKTQLGGQFRLPRL
jgi:hypothetical protein